MWQINDAGEDRSATGHGHSCGVVSLIAAEFRSQVGKAVNQQQSARQWFRGFFVEPGFERNVSLLDDGDHSLECGELELVADGGNQQGAVGGDLSPEVCIESVGPVAGFEANRGGSSVATAEHSVLVDGERLHGPWHWQQHECCFGEWVQCEFFPAGGGEQNEPWEADEEESISIVDGDSGGSEDEYREQADQEQQQFVGCRLSGTCVEAQSDDNAGGQRAGEQYERVVPRDFAIEPAFTEVPAVEWDPVGGASEVLQDASRGILPEPWPGGEEDQCCSSAPEEQWQEAAAAEAEECPDEDHGWQEDGLDLGQQQQSEGSAGKQ